MEENQKHLLEGELTMKEKIMRKTNHQHMDQNGYLSPVFQIDDKSMEIFSINKLTPHKLDPEIVGRNNLVLTSVTTSDYIAILLLGAMPSRVLKTRIPCVGERTTISSVCELHHEVA